MKIFWVVIVVIGISLLHLLMGPTGFQPTANIILQIRLPRLLLAIFAGTVLSVSGTALQSMLQNPLADPYILGISGGACFGAAMAILLGFPVPLFAFIGAIICIFSVYKLATFCGRVPRDTLLLSGVIVGTFMASIVMFIMISAGKQLEQILYLTMGYLGVVFRVQDFKIFGAVVGISAVISVFIARRAKELNILAFGEEEAITLGVEVERLKKEIFIYSSLLVGFCVAFCGAIGFIGLMVPHITRKIVGPDNRKLIIFAPLIGIILILVADIVASKTLQYELPISVITSFFGVPFFIWLLLRQKT